MRRRIVGVGRIVDFEPRALHPNRVGVYGRAPAVRESHCESKTAAGFVAATRADGMVAAAMPPPLILASTSPYRRDLLARLGAAFSCEKPGVDEDAVKRTLREPAAVVAELAQQKALAVAARHRLAIVVGSDQCATVDGRVLDKPGSADGATAQLRLLRGREHRLLTAVAIAHPGGLVAWTETTRLCMRALTDDEIARYVAAERPFDCAGSYKIEGLGISLFDAIDGADQTAIVGLPLLRLCRELRALGMVLP
jgi:septum formation protein